jgi:hypothetical protein
MTGNPRPAAAVMQPYFFPNLAYFQLAAAVDDFCFYDDVNFIKGGWINRNRILQSGRPIPFTIPLANASPNVPICETMTCGIARMRDKFHRSLKQAYGRLPRFPKVSEMVMSQLPETEERISDIASGSVRVVFEYLGGGPRFVTASEFAPETRELNRVSRLVALTQKMRAQHYINAIGGRDLYEKVDFEEHGIRLSFLQTRLPEYVQSGTANFVPHLSMIDVLMHNDPDDVRSLLNEWDLV